jgi:hypothetical protein
MWLNTEVFMEAGRALREEYPKEVREAGARHAVAYAGGTQRLRFAGRLLRRVGALLIASGHRLQGYGHPRGYTPFRV